MWPCDHQVMCHTWWSVGPQQTLYWSVGPHVPLGDKVRFINLISTSLVGVETDWVCLGYNDFEVIRYRCEELFLLYLVGISIGY